MQQSEIEKPNSHRLAQLVADEIPEGLRLEFKSSSVIEKSQTSIISKAVSAFANSAGGVLVIGMEVKKNSKGQKVGFELRGLSDTKDKTEWLEAVIEANTYPSIINYHIYNIADEKGDHFYWIEVGLSPCAPHQASDHVYYKRNGSSSIPMEHFEIEDVRSRVTAPDFPLDIGIEIVQGTVVDLVIRNKADRVIKNCRFNFQTVLKIVEATKLKLEGSGLNNLHGKQAAYYYLGSVTEFLSQESPKLSLKFEYNFQGRTVRDSREFDFQDFSGQLVLREPSLERLEKIADAIRQLGDKVGALEHYLTTISKAFSCSGLHISESSISAFQTEDGSGQRRYHISQMDIEGLRDVLKITNEQAQDIYRRFAYFGGNDDWQTYFDSLPPELQSRIRQKMEI